MLIFKLAVVPLALLLLGIVERRHGPRIAGWLAGFPVIAGPLLLFVSLDHGKAFGSAAALAAFFGLLPWLSFSTVYAYCARFWGWGWSAVAGFSAWAIVATVIVALQGRSTLLQILPFAAILGAIWIYPNGKASDEPREHGWWPLAVRVLAGAVLTFVIARFSDSIGSRWSGTFMTFPVMGSIVAIANHIEFGKRAVQDAAAGMALGLVSVAIFCFVLAQALERTGIGAAFGLAILAAGLAHVLTWRVFRSGNRAEA